jgi:hypothetical protein
LLVTTSVKWRAGQVVEVLSEDEILATLDENGELESLPFMPEMARYCGQRLTVGAVATKLCDTQNMSGMRRMDNAVHLSEVRCDGSAHGGCQATCLIYWKTAWLRQVDGPATVTTPPEPLAPNGSKLLPLLTAATRRPSDDDVPAYRCQVTELLRAAPDVLPWRDLGQYAEDVRSGNASVHFAARAFLIGGFNRVQDVSRQRLPRWLLFRKGLPWRFIEGGAKGRTPVTEMGFQPGDLVRIKSQEEIEATINGQLLNRGMGFSAEMARFCGRTGRVARQVTQILDEKTGKMIYMKNPCIVLEGIVCEGAFSASCPRGIPAYWREIWLDRVDEPALAGTNPAAASSTVDKGPL